MGFEHPAETAWRWLVASVIFALYVIAFLLFVLAGLGIPPHPRIQWLGWGLAALVLAELLSAGRGPMLPR